MLTPKTFFPLIMLSSCLCACVEPPPPLMETHDAGSASDTDSGKDLNALDVPDDLPSPADMATPPRDLDTPSDAASVDAPPDAMPPPTLHLSRDTIVSTSEDVLTAQDIANDPTISRVQRSPIVQGDVLGVEIVSGSSPCVSFGSARSNTSLEVSPTSAAQIIQRQNDPPYLRVSSTESFSLTARCEEFVFTIAVEVLDIASEQVELTEWYTSSLRGSDRLLYGASGNPLGGGEPIEYWVSRLHASDDDPRTVISLAGVAASIKPSPSYKPIANQSNEVLALSEAWLQRVEYGQMNTPSYIVWRDGQTHRSVTVVIVPEDVSMMAHPLLVNETSLVEIIPSGASPSIRVTTLSGMNDHVLEEPRYLQNGYLLTLLCNANNEMALWLEGKPLPMDTPASCQDFDDAVLLGSPRTDVKTRFSGEVYDVIIAETTSPDTWGGAIKNMHDFLLERYTGTGLTSD